MNERRSVPCSDDGKDVVLIIESAIGSKDRPTDAALDSLVAMLGREMSTVDEHAVKEARLQCSSHLLY